MGKRKLLICLLGGQTMPNVIAAAQNKPDVVWAVCSSESASLFENLRASLAHLPESPSEVKLVKVPPYDFDAIRNTIGSLLASESAKELEITIDVTGGTKVMSLGLCHTAWQKKITSCQYVVSERNLILEKLGMPTAREVSQEFRIPLGAYLAAHGFEGRPEPQPKILPSIFEFLLEDIERTWRSLNDLRESNGLQSFRATAGRLPYVLRTEEARRFFAGLCHHGYGEIHNGSLYLNYFEQSFLWGDWVEYYAARELKSLRREKVLDEAWGSTRIFTLDGRLWRELDAVAIRHGHLCVFSCKQTSNLLQKSYFDNLEGTRKDLGRYVSLFLLSVRRAGKDTVDTARRQGIAVIQSAQLSNLRTIVAKAASKPTVAL